MKAGRSTKIWHPEKSVILDCHIGHNCTIHAPVWIGNNVIIGDHCKVQGFAFIPDGVVMGNDVFIGPRATFLNDKHPPSDKWLQTIVKDRVSVGGGATILPGVVLGEGCVIGAGAVVTKDVGPWTTVVGNPARLIKRAA